jgi:hypothetical protein
MIHITDPIRWLILARVTTSFCLLTCWSDKYGRRCNPKWPLCIRVIKYFSYLITRVGDLYRASVYISGTREVVKSNIPRKSLMIPCAFGSPSSTKRQGHVLSTIFGTGHGRTFQPCGPDGPRPHDQTSMGESTYPMCGYPNLSVGICCISPRNRSRPPPLYI